MSHWSFLALEEPRLSCNGQCVVKCCHMDHCNFPGLKTVEGGRKPAPFFFSLSFPRGCMTLVSSSDVSYLREVVAIENHPFKARLCWLSVMSGNLSSSWGKWEKKMNSFVSTGLPTRNLALFVVLCCCSGKSKIFCPFQFPIIFSELSSSFIWVCKFQAGF